ncbi:unnamed protein product [Hymenolepis diminuta]|uniref:GON domain-containing protein n=1 Tax=Hymenolepis diminuta TaxID=6216 RepID=A0A0R3SK80_HYMDI|nr:unnamed protein product [Hymenolepis diminuta]VUZ39996.1 unnamed protein product [Hymenolepis diminuta]
MMHLIHLSAGGRSPAVRRTVRIRRHGSHLSSLEFDGSGTFPGSGGNWPKLGWSTPCEPKCTSSSAFKGSVECKDWRQNFFVQKGKTNDSICSARVIVNYS